MSAAGQLIRIDVEILRIQRSLEESPSDSALKAKLEGLMQDRQAELERIQGKNRLSEESSGISQRTASAPPSR